MKALISSRRILSLSVPIIVAGIGETIIEVTDAIFLARHDYTELAAIALADAIYAVAAVLLLGLVDGLQVLIARRAGEDRPEEIGRTFNQGVYLLGLVGLAVTVGLWLFASSITTLLISSDAIRSAAESFLHIVAFKLLFDGLNFAYGALFTGLSRTRPLIGATIALAVTNVVLDYCLIFGHWGMPEMGIRGAAIASLVAELVAFAYLTGSVVILLDVKRFGLFAFGKWNGRLAESLTRISSPVVVDGLVECARWILFFVIIERLGETPLAVSEMIYSCYTVFLIALDGFSEATCSMVSNLIGQGVPKRLWVLLRRAISLSYITTAPLLVLALLFPQTILSVFSDDAYLLEGSVNGLRVMAFAVLIVIPSDMYVSAVAGTGDTAAALCIEIVRSVCVLMLAYVAAIQLALPLEYVWMAEGIGWFVSAVLSYLWLRSGKWLRVCI